MTEPKPLPLAGRRVLDLTEGQAAFCARILADMGADVVKAERPGGDPIRRIGPFLGGVPNAENGIYWLFLNTNKRAITLDLESQDGRDILRKLCEGAHFVIESFRPGHLADRGIPVSVLQEWNPESIVVSISPFGQTGPRACNASSDNVLLATGGLMFLCGEEREAPLRLSVDQAWFHGSLQAAAAAMIAHYYRLTSGKGQLIDVSVQESIACLALSECMWWEYDHKIRGRTGSKFDRGNLSIRTIWPCLDGFVSWRIWVAQRGKATAAVVGWLDAEGMATVMKGADWEALDYNYLKQDQVDDWEKAFGRFFLRHTKAELYDWAIRDGVTLFPVNSVKDLSTYSQLQARDVWKKMDDPARRSTVTYAALPATGSLPRLPAPTLGQHNEEIYGHELGLSGRLASLKKAGVI